MAINNPILAGKEKEMLDTVKAGDRVWVGSRMESVIRTTRGKIFTTYSKTYGRRRAKEMRFQKENGYQENNKWPERIVGIVTAAEIQAHTDLEARKLAAEDVRKELHELFQGENSYDGYLNFNNSAGSEPQLYSLRLSKLTAQRVKLIAFYLKMLGEEQE